MPRILRDHVILDARTRSLPYTSVNRGRSIVIPRPETDVLRHGAGIREEFETAVEEAGFADRNFVYITFRSYPDFYLDIEKFDKGNFHLASFKLVEEDEEVFYEATVCINRDAVSQFLRKIEQYISGRTRNGNPPNQRLISNIRTIRASTLKSFWEEPEAEFPAEDQNVWWEVWFRKLPTDAIDHPSELIESSTFEGEVRISERFLSFAENWVFLMKGTVDDLSRLLLYTDRLAELRQPVEPADFFTHLEVEEQGNWIVDLTSRVRHNPLSMVSVCLLDTGVNRAHPLLEAIVPARHLESINPAWGTADGHPSGHGTPMAALALYGNLSPLLSGMQPISIHHQLESIRLVNSQQPHDPDVYGAVTQEAVARAVTINPRNKRLVCMAVTSNDLVHAGRPSSWSSAIDQLIFGTVETPNDNTVFFVSAGNVPPDGRLYYPEINSESSIEDPAQSFNAITVGAYTQFDRIDRAAFPGSTLVAERGAMAPCNPTSLDWHKEWCRKPDIVMEGGNHAVQRGGLITPDSLQLLSISKGGWARPPLMSFGDTSAATALAAGFGAELYAAYPLYRPETIRGLIVHSATWTPAMLSARDIRDLNEAGKIELLKKVGYGVPNMQRARYTANNSLSLIAERILQPYQLDEGRVKTNYFHFFDLPWPQETLSGLYNTEVTLTVTLSYFVEPNPGQKRYELAASYRSHGLRFKMRDRAETERAFIGRISKSMREEDYETEGHENWILGENVRSKGCLHKDIWKGPAADLALRNKIAVYPVGGWWKSRPALERYSNSVRYTLLISIDAPGDDVDILTPVLNEIEIELEG